MPSPQTPLQFFKSQGLNLYRVNHSKCPIYYNQNEKQDKGIPKFTELQDFSKFIKEIKETTSFGFLSGLQYKSNKYIIILDFDIYDKEHDNLDDETNNLFEKYKNFDNNQLKGFFEGSTCGNYSVIVDITDNQVLINKIEESRQVNTCKIANESGKLELLYNNNVVLPPSVTICKKCKTCHKPRKLLKVGFNVPNKEQEEFIIKLVNDFLENNKSPKVKKNKTGIAQAVAEPNIVVERISVEKMMKIIDCINIKKFENYDSWLKLVYMVANGNNTNEIIKYFWQKGIQVKKYSNVTLNEVMKAFSQIKISTEFNNYGIYNLAKKDNEELFNKYFNKYDEPTFEYNIMNFKDENGNQTKFLNFNQIMDYFGYEKIRVINSSYGSGKSQFCKKMLEHYDNENKNLRVLFISNRQTLAYNLENSFPEFMNYLNSKININTNKVIISLDSIERIALSGTLTTGRYDIVILDEFTSILSHFSYSKLRNPEGIYKMFKSIIDSCSQCYCLDGDINNAGIGFLQNYFNYKGKPLFNAVKGNSYNITINYNDNVEYENILNDLKLNRKLCIASMSSNMAAKIYDWLNTKGYKCLLITSKTSDFIKQQLKNINEIVKNYDVLIYSPTISVGVDISITNYFYKVYGYICSNSVDARSYFQMLARVRNPITNEVNLIITDNAIKQKGLYNIKNFEDYKREIYGDEPINGLAYIRLWNQFEENAKQNFLDVFLWYAERKGHKVNIIKPKENKEAKVDTLEEFIEYSIEHTMNQINEQETKKDNIISEYDMLDDVMNACVLSTMSINTDKLEKMEKEHEDYRNSLKLKQQLTSEEIKKLNEIDEIYGFNNINVAQKRVKEHVALSNDKNNIEKTIYFKVFNLDESISKEDFKQKYYRKLDCVKNYKKYKNYLENPDEKKELFDDKVFDKQMTIIEKLNSILNIENIDEKKLLDGSIIEDNYERLNLLFTSDNYKVIFGDIDGTKIKRNYKDKEEQLTTNQVLNKLKLCYKLIGLELNYTRVKKAGKKEKAYEFVYCDALNEYLKKSEIVEIDF